MVRRLRCCCKHKQSRKKCLTKTRNNYSHIVPHFFSESVFQTALKWRSLSWTFHSPEALQLIEPRGASCWYQCFVASSARLEGWKKPKLLQGDISWKTYHRRGFNGQPARGQNGSLWPHKGLISWTVKGATAKVVLFSFHRPSDTLQW